VCRTLATSTKKCSPVFVRSQVFSLSLSLFLSLSLSLSFFQPNFFLPGFSLLDLPQSVRLTASLWMGAFKRQATKPEMSWQERRTYRRRTEVRKGVGHFNNFAILLGTKQETPTPSSSSKGEGGESEGGESGAVPKKGPTTSNQRKRARKQKFRDGGGTKDETTEKQ